METGLVGDFLKDHALHLMTVVGRGGIGKTVMVCRLDAQAQQVMQALAAYAYPVAPAAVDYLLQPHVPNIYSAPLLRRLVNMQFARSEAGRYHLHQVDRDYALGRVPRGEPADREATPAPFTQLALLHRAAEYFEQMRTPRETWRRRMGQSRPHKSMITRRTTPPCGQRRGS